MRAAGLKPDPELVLVGEAFIEAEGERLCQKLLDGGRQFTAVVAGNDLMALGVSCPADISLVGFNDMPFAEWFSPPLTTIRIPHYEIGSQAAELLLELLDGEGEHTTSQLLLAPELVVRGSTRAPKSADMT